MAWIRSQCEQHDRNQHDVNTTGDDSCFDTHGDDSIANYDGYTLADTDDSNSDCYSDTNLDGDCNTYSNTDRDANANTDRDTNADLNTHTDRDTNADPNSYSNTHTDRDAHANTDANTRASGDSPRKGFGWRGPPGHGHARHRR